MLDFDIHCLWEEFSFIRIEFKFVGGRRIQYNATQRNATQYNTIQYNTIQYNTIQYNTIQYNTIQSTNNFYSAAILC